MDDQGRGATKPWQMPRAALFSIAKRAWSETGRDNIGLIAAGVAFYGFLALVPLLGATVLTYGLVADPASVVRDMRQMTEILPPDVAQLVGEQLLNVVETSDGKKGLGLLLALALALFGARNGAGAIITALNIAYEETEKRGFVMVNLLALGMTAAAVVVAILALIAITALGYLESLIPNAPEAILVVSKVAAYVVLAMAGAAAAAALYRYGPSRQRARWVWITPGSLLTALLWLALTIGFGIYVANFSNYNATYGSLGAVAVTLTWLYLSSYILLFGAELNAEFEHQTARDSTRTGAPLGQRGAWAADHVAGVEGDAPSASPPPPPAPPGTPALRAQVAAAGAASKIADWAGLPEVKLGSAVTATLGLSMLRRGRAGPGAALILGVSALAWIRREKTPIKARKIEAVFFDVDGTLVDSNGHHVNAWALAFAEAGFEIERGAIAGQIGKGGDLLVPALLPDIDDAMEDRLIARHSEVFKTGHLDMVKPFPGAAALIGRLAKGGRRVVLASSADGPEVQHHLARLGVKRFVDAITTSDDVETSKPGPDIFAAALKRVKPLAAEQVIVVGDTPYDVQAASGCGIRTVAVRSGGFSDDVLLGAGAVALYDDVADILANFETSPLNA